MLQPKEVPNELVQRVKKARASRQWLGQRALRAHAPAECEKRKRREKASNMTEMQEALKIVIDSGEKLWLPGGSRETDAAQEHDESAQRHAADERRANHDQPEGPHVREGRE